MKKYFSTLPLLALLAACGPKQSAEFIITVTNEQAFDRSEEMVEVPISAVTEKVQLIDEEQYIVVDAEGNQVPYQITYDDKILFPATVRAGSETIYKVQVGEPIEPEKLVYGRHYPERVDDIAWENDRTAYRAYGPALQRNGERAFGYDAWVKRVPHLVVEQRYATELNVEARNEIRRLKKERKFAEADEIFRSISYHVDHGDGLDCYKVGPTLGCGTAALLEGEAIVYPYCWKNHEILENGPLRFTVKMEYNPLTVNGASDVVETRIVSLDKGSQLNKTVVSYAGLKQPTPVATGLVIHPENQTSDAYAIEAEKGYIAYADLTDNVNNDNGIIFVGAVVPEKVNEAKVVMFPDKEAKERGASGHVLAISDYKPGSEYIYYWGSGWTKYGFASMDEWTAYLDRYAQCVRNPLKVTF